MAIEWRAVAGYDGLYQVSNTGLIRNSAGLVLKDYDNGRGYRALKLARSGTKRHHYVHRLVAAAFLGPSDLEVNHLDGDKTNNCASNLEYTTRTGNNLHARRVLKRHVGEDHCYAKLTEDSVRRIRELAQTNKSYADIGKKFGIAADTVSKVVRGRSWQSVSFGLNAPKRVNRGEQSGKTTISESDVREIRRMAADGVRHAEIRDRFGIALVTISRIVNRHSWAHVQ